MFSSCKSFRGNTCAQIFATDFHFVRAFPIKSKWEAHFTLDDFFTEVGVPRIMIPDNAKELTLGDFRRKCRKAQCKIQIGRASCRERSVHCQLH